MENTNTLQLVTSLVSITSMPILIRVAYQVKRILEKFDAMDKRVVRLEKKYEKEIPKINNSLAQVKARIF